MLRVRRLANGLRVILEPRSHAKTTCVVVGIGRGSADEPKHYAGIFHFLEHLVLCHPWQGAIEKIDAMGSEANATTNLDMIMFYFTVPNRYVIWALDLLEEIVKRPGFSEDTIVHERGVVLEEGAEYQDMLNTTLEYFRGQQVFGKHPLARSELGTRSSLERLTLRILSAFWARLIDPRHMAVTVVGGFDRPRVWREIKQRFGALSVPAHPLLLREQLKPKRYAQHAMFSSERYGALKQVNFFWNIALPGYHSKYRLPLMVLSNIMAGRYSSEIFKNLRDQGLVYSLEGDIWFFPEAGYITLNSSCTRESLMPTLELIRNTLTNYHDQGVSRAEFDLAVKNVRASAIMHFEKTQYSAKFYTGQALAHDQIIPLPAFLRHLRHLRRADVNRAAEIFLRPRYYYLGAAGPLTRTDKVKIGAMFKP